MLSSVSNLLPELHSIKSEVLRSLELPEDVIHGIHFAKSPNRDLGDYGFPVFALARHLKQAPPKIAVSIVERLNSSEYSFIDRWVAVGPYVNVFLNQSKINELVLSEALAEKPFGSVTKEKKENWMIEFSSPNTNKPQHLGHVRNNLLGDVSSRLLAFQGDNVVRVNLINDRGIHICKSMLAYEKCGNGELPTQSAPNNKGSGSDSGGTHRDRRKGDHLVGKYYVLYNNLFKEEYAKWLESDDAKNSYAKAAAQKDGLTFKAFAKEYEDRYFNEKSAIGAETKEMLRKWEANDPDVRALWEKMNSWVFAGFKETYDRLGITFDRVYKESETYLLGREIVEEGLAKGVFTRLEDGAVVCDLAQIGLPGQTKILLRNDGTCVYMTQDLGTALARFEDYDIDRMVYCVGNEQEYHFQVLFGILGLIRPELQGDFYHLSYGMVELPDGKMKSREGTVVDADDLIAGTVALARNAVEERYDNLSDEEIARRAEAIGLAGLKYNILDYNPKTTVHFDPKKSLEFQGRMGPYLLYTYARIQSILRALDPMDEDFGRAALALTTPLELDVIAELQEWPYATAEAARLFEPSRVTEQLFRIAKAFSTLYNDPDHRLRELDGDRLMGLVLICKSVAKTLKTGLNLLGLDVLEEM